MYWISVYSKEWTTWSIKCTPISDLKVLHILQDISYILIYFRIFKGTTCCFKILNGTSKYFNVSSLESSYSSKLRFSLYVIFNQNGNKCYLTSTISLFFLLPEKADVIVKNSWRRMRLSCHIPRTRSCTANRTLIASLFSSYSSS